MFACLVSVPFGFAQELKEDAPDIPASPQNHILDETGFFRDHPEQLDEVSQSLERMQSKYGYPVYLVIYYSVFEGNLQRKAEELHRAWLGDKGQGMVLVYQRDPVAEGNNPAIAYYKGSELDSGQTETMQPKNLIPRRDTEMMLANVFRKMKSSSEDGRDYVAEIIHGIEHELDAYFKVEPVKWNDSSNLRLMSLFAGAVVALGLLGMIFWRVFARADSRSGREYYFPDIKTGRRLGAPFGGGWTSSKTFVPASSRK